MNYSASRLSLYSDCSLHYKFQYVDKISHPNKSIHLAYGSSIHKALEELNLSLIKNKYDLEDVFQAFHNEWNLQLEQQGLKGNYFELALYEMGLNSLESYYLNNVDYEVLDAEIKFSVPIIYPDGTKCEHGLTGLIDVIIKRKNQLTIVDYKTSKESYSRFQLDTSLQLAIYSYAFRYLVENNLINLGKVKKQKEDYISYYVLLKDYENKEGKIKIQRKEITERQYNKMFYIIKKTIDGEKAGIYIPNYNSQCKYCPFQKECLEFEG